MPDTTSISAPAVAPHTAPPATLDELIQSIPSLDDAADPSVYLVEPMLSPLQIILIVVACIIILLVTSLLILRKPKATLIPESPAETALRKLNALKNSIITLREASIETSLYLREFLTGKANDPALFETQQEFNLRDSSLDSIPAQFRDDTRELLDKLARLKYAPETSTDNEKTQSMISEAAELVRSIDLAIQQSELDKQKGGLDAE